MSGREHIVEFAMYGETLPVFRILPALDAISHVGGTVIPVAVLSAINILITYGGYDPQPIVEESVAI